jgi:ATP-binding cassette subfamily C protein
MFADGKAPPGEKVSSAEAKIAEPQPVKPSMREEAKTPAPGSTVVIEQTTPAPPLRSGGGDRDSGGFLRRWWRRTRWRQAAFAQAFQRP